jgi:flagellar L-ring protein precursor FlgH
MKSALRALALLALPALLAACASLAPPPVRLGPIDEPPSVSRNTGPRGTSGGVFSSDLGLSLTSDSRAFRVGDVVTINLQETTQASKKAGTSFSKNSADTINAPNLLGKSFPKAGLSLGANNTFAGDATSTQQNALTGAITVIVQEVLPNGLLRVAGEKTLTLNQGEEFVRLRGYLRAADIDADNQVSSLRIANARIAYSAQGTLADTQQPGWLTRFFTGPLMPF